jgi:hypothetical protein
MRAHHHRSDPLGFGLLDQALPGVTLEHPRVDFGLGPTHARGHAVQVSLSISFGIRGRSRVVYHSDEFEVSVQYASQDAGERQRCLGQWHAIEGDE